MTHLLVTNDFPPKLGGIQSYLWELWRRLPPSEAVVLTASHPKAKAFDAAQPLRIERTRERVLLPTPNMARRIRRLADQVEADVVVVDPALPLGLLGPFLGRPYVVIAHGAEVGVPSRLPLARPALGFVMRRAAHVIAGSHYAAAEVERAARATVEVTLVPPGVDVERFHPLSEEERKEARFRFGLADAEVLVVSVSRLVPRKGMDVLIRAAGLLMARHPGLVLAVAGGGREHARLQRLAAVTKAPVRFLGRVPDDQLPSLYGCADVFAMLCRNRWGGLEQEGFGIVFLEAAACGVPQVAGASGGAPEAVIDGETGIVVRHPADPRAAAVALQVLLDDPAERARQGEASRRRAVAELSYDILAARLNACLTGVAASG